MKWRQGRRSENVEDIRGGGSGGFGGYGGGRVVQVGGGGLGCVLVLLLLSMVLGVDLTPLAGGLGGQEVVVPAEEQAPAGAPGARPPDEAADFVSVILADTEDTWGALFSAAGETYDPPKLVLYEDMVQSACGVNSAATGPFYCPMDQKVYLDLGFLRELRRLGAPGDFAFAYVIAHEVGHHLQHLMGTDAQVQRLQRQVSQADANALSVLMELQADCYAGVWANHAQAQRQILEEGDVEEGINAAASVGDDRLARMAGRSIPRDAFTHGSSQERVAWFNTGWESGDLEACDTFARAGLR